MVKLVPQADAKSASMGWFFDPGFIQNVQRVASDIENPSMESIDSVLFALREMGYIKTASTCEHGFTVDECVTGICELQTEHAALRARLAEVEAQNRCLLEEVYDLADSMCLEYHECVGALAQRDGLKITLDIIQSGFEIRNGDPHMDGTFDQFPHALNRSRMMEIAREALAKLEANDGK